MDFNKDFLKSVIRHHKGDEEYYSTVMCTTIVPHDFFYSNLVIFDTFLLTKYCELEDETIQYLLDDDIEEKEHILKYKKLSSSLLKKYIEKGDVLWNTIAEYQDMSCNIMQQYIDNLDWMLISENQFMDLQFLIKNIDNIQWDQLPFNPRMKMFINEGMITLFQQTNIWDNIGYCDNIDLDTMLKYKSRFNLSSWDSILDHRDLTEDQTVEFTDIRKDRELALSMK